MATDKLYWQDSLLLRFEASLVGTATWKGRPSVVLDRTAFYPEGGGQLPDEGRLRLAGAEVGVADVQIDDEGVIHHVLDGDASRLLAESGVDPAGPDPSGRPVEGDVDGARRRDHMSQHTGQHMLSRALLDVVQGATVSSRLGSSASTVDLSLAAAPEGLLAQAEDLANAVVLDDREIRQIFPTAEELARLPLRREPKVEREVRVIEIEGFDLSPCGGTHCRRTGEVGPIRIVGIERYKGLLRVTFLAGLRAMRDYRAKDEALGKLARSFTCGPLEVEAAVASLRSDLKERGDQLSFARGELVRRLGAEVLAAHPPDPGGTTLVILERPGDDLGTARALASAIARRPDAVALVATRDRESGDWLVVAERGEAAGFDAGKWLKDLAARHGGRGGGRPERAEGRLPGGVAFAEVARSSSA
jgi:alanyl-tRNA synthetase